VLHRVSVIAFQRQARADRDLSHLRCGLLPLWTQPNLPAGPSVEVQPAERFVAAWLEWILALPGRSVLSGRGFQRLARVGGQVEQQGVKERLTLQDKGDAPCEGAICKVQLLLRMARASKVEQLRREEQLRSLACRHCSAILVQRMDE